MTCGDRLQDTFLQAAKRHHEPSVESIEHTCEVGRLKRQLAIARQELADWRDQFHEYKYHPQSRTFSCNGGVGHG